MVSAARLEWIISELSSGRQASVKLLTYSSHVTVKVCLKPERAPHMRNMLVIYTLQSMLTHINEAVVVDHGHRKSNGETHVSFSMKPLPTATGMENVGAPARPDLVREHVQPTLDSSDAVPPDQARAVGEPVAHDPGLGVPQRDSDVALASPVGPHIYAMDADDDGVQVARSTQQVHGRRPLRRHGAVHEDFIPGMQSVPEAMRMNATLLVAQFECSTEVAIDALHQSSGDLVDAVLSLSTTPDDSGGAG